MSSDISRELLSSAWKVSLEEEMKKFPDLKQEDVAAILKWSQQQPHLPVVSEHTAALFLVLASYNIDMAQVYIENHYTFRTYYRTIFSERDPLNKGIQEVKNLIGVTILDGQCKAGCRVVATFLKSTDSAKFVPSNLCKLVYMIMERDTLENGFSRNGYKLIMNAAGFGFGHLTSITPSFLKQVFSYFLDGANVAIVEIIIINVNAFVEKLMFLVKALAPPSIYERIKLFSKDKNHLAFEKFPTGILPKEYGGSSKPLNELSDECQKTVERFRSWYLADEKYLRVDESKRPPSKQNKKVVKLQESLKSMELD